MTAPRPIFVHGAVGGSACWEPVAARFEGAAVLALPGHPAGAPLADADALVGWLALAAARIPGPRVIVGHGLGALVALEAARTHRHLIQGVVAAGAATRLSVPSQARPGSGDPGSVLLRFSIADPGRRDTHALEASMRDVPGGALDADLALCRSTDIGATAAGVTCPVLLITGEHDRWAPPAAAAALAGALPDARLIVVPDAHHLVPFDARPAVQLLVAAFLASVELSPDPR